MSEEKQHSEQQQQESCGAETSVLSVDHLQVPDAGTTVTDAAQLVEVNSACTHVGENSITNVIHTGKIAKRRTPLHRTHPYQKPLHIHSTPAVGIDTFAHTHTLVQPLRSTFVEGGTKQQESQPAGAHDTSCVGPIADGMWKHHFDNTPQVVARRLLTRRGHRHTDSGDASGHSVHLDRSPQLDKIQDILRGVGSPSVVYRDGNVALVDKSIHMSTKHMSRLSDYQERRQYESPPFAAVSPAQVFRAQLIAHANAHSRKHTDLEAQGTAPGKTAAPEGATEAADNDDHKTDMSLSHTQVPNVEHAQHLSPATTALSTSHCRAAECTTDMEDVLPPSIPVHVGESISAASAIAQATMVANHPEHFGVNLYTQESHGQGQRHIQTVDSYSPALSSTTSANHIIPPHLVVNNIPIVLVCESIIATAHQSGTIFRIEGTSTSSSIVITLPDPLERPGMQFTFVLAKPRLGQVVSIVSDGLNGHPFEWSTMVDGNPVTFSLQPRIVNAFDRSEPNTFHTTPFTLISGRDICGRGIWFSNNLTFGWLPMRNDTHRYAVIKDQIQDLDLIFFKGNAFVSKIITTMTRWVTGKGDWSHVGLVVSKRLLPNLKTDDPPDTLYIWESTLSSNTRHHRNDSNSQQHADTVQGMLQQARETVCAESNKPVFGVQVRRLDDVLQECFRKNVRIGWGKLIVSPQRKRLDETEDMYIIRLHNMKLLLNNLHDEYYHRPYEKNPFRLASSLTPCLKGCRSDCCPGRTWIFCSQLVGIIYQQLGLIDQQIDPGAITPQMLANPETSHTVNIMRIIAPPIVLTS
jgi:hypothetical protein